MKPENKNGLCTPPVDVIGKEERSAVIIPTWRGGWALSNDDDDDDNDDRVGDWDDDWDDDGGC
jgi:hypothetical protein